MMASLRKLLARQWLLLLCGLLAGVVAGTVSASRRRPLYVATGQVIIAGGGMSRRPGGLNRETELRQQALYAFRSVPLLTMVAQDVGMLPRAGHFMLNDAVEPAEQRLAIARLRAGLTIEASESSEVISLSFMSQDAEFSAAVINRLIMDSMRYSVDVRMAAFNSAAHWPASQIDVLRQQVATTENHLLDTQRTLNLPLYNSEASRLDKPALDLSQDLTRARLARLTAQAEYALLRQTSDGVSSQTPATRGLQSTRSLLLAARASLAALAATDGDRNPELLAGRARVHALEATLAAEQQRDLRTAQARFRSAQDDEDALRAALRQENMHLANVGRQSLELKRQQRDFFETRLLYTTLYTQLRTAMLDAGLRPSQIELLDLAAAPQRSVSAASWQVALQYGVEGLLMAAVLGLALTNLRLSPMERVFQTERTTDLPALAALPLIALRSQPVQGLGNDPAPGIAVQNLELLGSPQSAFSNGIRSLAGSLRLATLEQEPRFILFTSATPSEGKSTVSSNYAAALAASGSPTLLIDADMHRPNLHHRLGTSGARGLSSLLSGSGTLQGTVQPVAEAGGLHLLAAGPVPPRPGHLLEQPLWVELLREAATCYTYIVIDSPPVLAVEDSLLLGRHVDAVVYVVRPGKVARGATRRGRDLLVQSGAPMAGVVVNALPVRPE